MPENVCIVYSKTEKIRTIIYKTFTDDNIVFIEQFKEENEWATTNHMMLSTQVLTFAQEFSRESSQEVTFLDLLEPARVYVEHTDLPENLRLLLYKYDVKATPFGENQLTIVQQTEFLLQYWGLETHFFSPLSPVRNEEFVILSGSVTPIRNQTADNETDETPTGAYEVIYDDDETPQPSRCWAPKKRRLSLERQENREGKILRSEAETD